jgi:hypothetical protein
MTNWRCQPNYVVAKLLPANCLIALSLLTLITRLKIITVAKQGARVSYQTSNQMRLFMRDWVFAAVFQHTTNYRCRCNVWDAESVFTQHFLIMPKWRSIILYCTFCGCPFVRIICYSRELRTKKKWTEWRSFHFQRQRHALLNVRFFLYRKYT